MDWTPRDEPLGSKPAPVIDMATQYPDPVGTPNPRAPRPRRTGLIVALIAAVAVLGGGGTYLALRGGSDPTPAAAPSPTHSSLFASAASTPPTESAAAVVTVPTSAAPRFPAGYPKVVKVSSLPSQVKNWYNLKGVTEAVALAPGVWTPLPPGATVDDAVGSGSLDGYCASIAAYERQYLGGEERGGACW